uniref:FAT atypical cadherin 2 n=1 Tax=Cyprinus carpio carpio TaxID=630221 RepID=A0A9J8BM33_CYPCA
MAFTDTAIILIVIAVLGTQTRCQGSLVKDNSLLRFTHHLYNASIYENSAPRTYTESPVRMGIILSDPFWDVKYKIVSGDDDGLFKVEEITVGDFCFLRIKTRSSYSAVLNREVRDIYTLTVEATESTYDNHARTKVSIQVLDTNDLKPLFYPASYHVAIKEDTPIKSSLVGVSATDADIGSNAEFYYSFTTRSHPFAVDPFTGTITLIKTLDASQRDRYELTVLAEDRTKKISGVQKFGNVAKVVVIIQNVTENFALITPTSTATPQTDDDKISLNIKMEPKEKEKVASLSIVEGDPLKCFQIIPSTLHDGGFQLVSTKWIDWSQNPFGLNISLQAKDGRNPPLLTPIKTVHIPPPPQVKPLTFEQELYYVTLSEFSPPKSHVVRVSVGLSFKNITYSIKDNLDSYKFKISTQTGVIMTSQTLDFEKHHHYEFDVTANNGEAFTRVVVDIIDENDNSPRFTLPSYQASLPENVPIGTSILAVSAIDFDKDNNGFVTYSIANTGPVPFIIDPLTGVISTSQEFDYELMKRWYHLRIWASDSGSPFNRVSECSATITMTNVNDNVPVFERVACNASIPRDFAVGESIAEMSALDLDELQQIIYRIESGNDDGLFAINPVSGSIKLAKAIPSNYKGTENTLYILKITATDGKYSADPNTVTVRITSKGEGASTHCEETGITRQLTEKLIESFKPSLNSKEDEYISDVHIINQHSPKFITGTPSSIDIREDFALDRSVLQFNATDNDSGFNGKLVYAISSGNEDGCFTIDMNTGELQVISALDREQKEFYILNITVYDLGSPQTSTWKLLAVNVLDANENPPLFSQPRYVVNIPENTEVDKSIFKVNAIDLDSGDNGAFKYSLLTFTDLFKIDEVTGVVKVTGPLDRETFSRYDLTIEARDQAKLDPQLFSFTDLVVVLEDINDNPPKFVPTVYRIKVPEDVPPGSVLLWVESFDLDLESGGLISYNLKNSEAGAFFLDTSTGCLTLERELDFEKQQFYNLTVRAVDHGKPRSLSSSCFIEVEVLDVNENLNRPLFTQFVHNAAVMEDATVGTSVLTLTTVDNDLGRDGVVRYYIHDGSGLGIFTIDEETGMIVITTCLSYEGAPPLSSTATVIIEVLDENDNSPQFSHKLFQVKLPERQSTAEPQEIYRMVARDDDVGPNGMVTYRLEDGSEARFDIHPETGVVTARGEFVQGIYSILTVWIQTRVDTGSIRVSDALDKHPQEQYHLTVKATDQGFPQRSALCPVTITVKLSEFTPPKFSSEEYITEISEAVPPGSPALSVSASCPSSVLYRINDGDPNGTFHININSGHLSVQNALDFEQHSSYRLTIRAINTAGVSSDAVVYIYVIDENDNGPVFHQDTYYGQISESAPINSMVTGENNTPLVIKASDADKDTNALLIFQILEPAAQKVFNIDPSMGTISLKSMIDFEATPDFFFSVQVWDSGEPPLSASKPCRVNIRVLDINDCPPKFALPVYETALTLPVFEDMDVIQVTAHDADSAVAYMISESTNKNAFKIDQSTGIISVNDSSELQFHNELKITASDGLYKDTTIVKFNITNATKTSLKFEDRMYVATVLENSTSIKILAVLKTTGSYLNEPLQYTVLNPHGKFAVVPSSGVLQTTGVPFDREVWDKYDVAVEVRDMRHPPRVDITHVKVYIDDINDNAPEISNLPHSLMISDETEPGDVLFQVLATDNDSGENGSILFSLEDDFGLFRIDRYLGDVSLLRPLDFESVNKYVLTVLVSDEGEPSLSAAGTLYVQVQNRSHPIFQSLYYPLKLPENIKPLTTILHVQARNPEGYRLIYNLEEDNASRFFNIDFKTGVLSVTDFLDFETQTKHILTVRATDSVTGTFAEAKVEIDVEDINDNAPVFQSLSYVTDMSEGLPIGTSVLQVSAVDNDSGRNSDITYQLVDKENEFFEIDPLSGILVTSQVLDYETTQQFTLKVKVTDKGAPPLSGEAQIIVNVIDVNDNPPDFNEPSYRASLDEKATCGHIVIKVQALDPDSKDDLQYKILSGNEGRYFSINESSGLISFSNVCKRNLDPFYNLTVAVSDGVFQKTAPVNIDMTNGNKHSPYFSQNIYEADLAENSEVGTRVIRLAAIDPDDGPYGSVDYTIINKLADEKFSISEEGQIVTSQSLDRENPSQRVIAIKVMAKDGGGRVGFCTVKIILTDENDNAPQFKASEYQVSIQSTVNKGSPVIQIMAYDADEGKNADVTYTVDEAEEVMEDIIEVNPFTGVVSVKESLVGLENKIFSFKIKARDGGIPFYNSSVPVQVKVVPPEVTLPQFTEPLYSFSASEDLPIGYEIGTVKADTDMPLIYSLVNGNTIDSNKEHVFAVDKDSGTLVMQKNIDHEKTKTYKIDVIAQGNHNGTDVASLVSVHIEVQDVNDNQPVFETDPYEAFLAENLPPGTTVIQVTANDADTNINGEVSYTLEPDSDDIGDMFAIDSQTGWITTLKKADSETKQLYRFYVVATDHGDTVKLSSSVLVEVTITDENDNPPQFTEELYQGSILENSRPGETIVTLTTADKDVSAENREIVCYITDGDPLGQFSVTAAGEEWTVIAKSPLDREDKDKYTLKIIATDGRFQTSANVEVHVLDLNDNSPLCEQLLYTEAVMENSLSGLFILKISASDPDIGTNGQVSFSLYGPNADKFHLDSKTGELFTLAVLDRERETEYDLVVKATDGGGRSCQADVTLMVQDMNDNPPQFSTSHYEITVFDNTTIRTPIAVIYAKDPDTGINSQVRYSLQGADSGFFSLDEISGILRLERSLADETKSTYEMKVKATDRGLPRHLFSIATITVHMVVLSDYQPLFLSSEYFVQIPESLQIGSEVISVSALTKDDTESEPVHYSIISGNEDGRFQINLMTGLLSLNSALDFELCREYYLSVEGARGKPLLSDIATVIINITDVNDNPPVFNRSSYSVLIFLSLTVHLSQVRAIDLDGPPNNFIIYSIVSGDPKQQFSIDPHTGHITVRSMLDREVITHYSLTVQAADEGDPPLSSAVQVTVTVSDVNDNPPMFSQINHSLILQEGEAVGGGILQLLVTDRDTPQNGPPFLFHIVSGNEDRSFHIDQGGLLSVSSPLRRRAKPQHLLKIQVTDSGHPPLSSICVVKINITEQSRYPPTVTPLEVFITTAGGVFSKRVIGKLHATDQDPQDVLSYKLVSDGPDQGLFSVDAVDGKIVVEKNLDPGLYHLNVSVSDGKFSIWTGVKVHVWAPAQHDLDQGFTLQLAGLSAEEFVSDHWRGLQRSLGLELNIPRQDLCIASLQQQPNSINMEVLLVRRAQDGSVQPVSTQRLTGVLSTVEDTLGLNILRLKHDGCVGAGCPPRGCRNAVVMRQGRMSNYATTRANFITPQHRWESVCSCNESAVRFDGKGYLKYLYQMEESKENFHLSLRLKTSAAEGTVMSTNASDWGKLELVDKELWFRYRCGNMLPASLHVANHPVADGRWHHVSLEVNGSTLRLAIDASHSNSVVLPQPCRLSQSGGALVLANSNPSTDAGELGFTGCLESIQFNGEMVRGEEGMTGTGPQTGRLFGIYQCCPDVKICASNPCENGGTCVEDPSEGGKAMLLLRGNICKHILHCFTYQFIKYNLQIRSVNLNAICTCGPLTHSYIQSIVPSLCRCQNACTPNACRDGFECSVAGNSIHCKRNTSLSYVEIAEICAGILGLVLLVVAFVCFRKHYVSRKKHKSGCVQDSNGYFPTLPKNMMKATEISSPMEISTLIGTTGDLVNSPFRSLKPCEQRELGPQVGSRSQGPVICSVAPNLPPPPSTSSDNDSIRKNNWEHDYEVYPADPDYYGRPTVQEFPQFDIVESTYSTASTESRRNSRFGGFPFPLDRADRRAPLPPCYSNQNLDDFLGPDGLPLPSSQCPNEYTAISYYPTQNTHSLENVSSGFKRLSVRLSVAQPSYADGDGSTRPGSTRRTPRSYAGSDMVESDYGSCEEVMF